MYWFSLLLFLKYFIRTTNVNSENVIWMMMTESDYSHALFEVMMAKQISKFSVLLSRITFDSHEKRHFPSLGPLFHFELSATLEI